MVTGVRPSRTRYRFAWPEVRHGETSDLRRRRWITLLSLIGIGAMLPVSLLQLHLIRHLPDPPWPHFNSDKANLSPKSLPLRHP